MRALVYLFVVCAMLFWGLSFVWTKQVFETYGPFTVVFLRMFGSSLLLGLISVFSRPRQKVAKGDLRLFLWLAFFEPFCYFLGESFGLLEVSSSVASLIIATIPIFMVVISPWTERERVGWKAVLGTLLSFIGLFLVIFEADLSLRYSPRGLALLFFAVVSAVGYNLMTRRLSGAYNPLTIVRWQNGLGALFFLPLFVLFEGRSFVTIVPPAAVLWSLLALTVFCSTLAFLMYVFAIARIGMLRANVFTNLIPVFAVLFSFLLLGETFDARKLLGMACILTGVVVAQLRRPGGVSRNLPEEFAHS